MKITLDCAGVGTGKTYSNIKRINSILDTNPDSKIVFVSKSIHVTENIQFHAHLFESIRNINHKTITSNSVATEFFIHYHSPSIKLLIITDVTFVKIDWSELDISNTHFIFDEFVNPYTRFDLVKKTKLRDWIATLSITPTDDEDWYNVSSNIDPSVNDDVNPQLYNYLYHSQWNVEITKQSMTEFHKAINSKSKISNKHSFYITYNWNVLEKAASVHMSGANIEHEVMFNQLATYFDIEVIRPFTRHDNPISIMVPNYSIIKYTKSWSMGNVRHPSNEVHVRSLLKLALSGGDPTIIIKNNVANAISGATDTMIESITRLKNNPHGSNDYKTFTNFICLTIINYGNLDINYLSARWKVTEINAKHHASLYYQTVGRGVIRVNDYDSSTMWTLRTDVALFLQRHYFTDVTIKEVPVFNVDSVIHNVSEKPDPYEQYYQLVPALKDVDGRIKKRVIKESFQLYGKFNTKYVASQLK